MWPYLEIGSLEMSSSSDEVTLEEGGPNPMTSVPIRRGRFGHRPKGGCPVRRGQELGVMQLPAKEHHDANS